MLSDIAADQGRLEDAVSLLVDGYRISRDLNEVLLIAADVCRFAHVLALAGRAVTATRVLSCSAALLDELGAMPAQAVSITEATLAAVRTDLDEAAFADAWAEGQALTADEAVALALDSID